MELFDEEEKETWEQHLSLAIAQSNRKFGGKTVKVNLLTVDEKSDYDDENASAEEV